VDNRSPNAYRTVNGAASSRSLQTEVFKAPNPATESISYRTH